MARFRYSLQGVLNIKLKMETQAKLEFAEAMNELNAENDKLEALYDRKREYEEKRQSLLQGKLDLLEIEISQNAVDKMDEYILIQKDNIRMAEKKVEQARLSLQEIMMDRKAYEALREKAFEAFMQEENRIEGKTVDELTSYTYGQKRQVDN